jgi:hypothetical protein
MGYENDAEHGFALVLVGLACLIAGIILGQFFAELRKGERTMDWPATSVPHPRTLRP